MTSTVENKLIKSFKANGVLVNGDNFVMPNKNVLITNIVMQDGIIIESDHYSYGNGLNDIKEKSFAGAKSLQVKLEFETDNADYDSIYLYDNELNKYGPFGGEKGTEVITISDDSVKILFKTDWYANNYYGYKATIIPSYPTEVYNVNIAEGSNVNSSLSTAWEGKKITLTSTLENKLVKSFKVNGELVEGDSFVMPKADVSVMDVVFQDGTIIESNHYPYPNSLNEIKEKNFPNAKALNIKLEYETESEYYDYIKLYDLEGNEYGKYGGNKNTENIVLDEGYVRLEFITDSSGTELCYGYKATITPIYPDIVYNVNLVNVENVNVSATTAWEGRKIKLTSTLEN